MVKVKLPEAIEGKMNLWREGFNALPKEYIEFHLELARKAKELLNGFVIHKEWVESDGWMDGMKVLWLIVEKNNKLYKLYWMDGNQEFFVQSGSGGSYPFRMEKV